MAVEQAIAEFSWPFVADTIQALPRHRSPLSYDLERSAEMQTQVRLRRPSELVQQPIDGQDTTIEHLQRLITQHQTIVKFKYSTLIHCRDDGLVLTLPASSQQYNHHQTIETGNKEMQGTFFVQYLTSSSAAGIQWRVLFTGLAANVVCWCILWLKHCTPEPTLKFARVVNRPKHLVHVAADGAALAQQTRFGRALRFALDNRISGVLLLLKHVAAFQLAFGFSWPCIIESG